MLVLPQILPGRTSSNRSGLNMGRDTEEDLIKYIDRTGKVGRVANLSIPIDISVAVDQVEHAADQIYRWEHRFDQVDESEIMSDVEMAAPKIVELFINDAIAAGTSGNRQTGQGGNNMGFVWLFNIETRLNTILQVKNREQRDHNIKLVVITVLRAQNASFSKRDSMVKITISSSEARVVYVPKKQ